MKEIYKKYIRNISWFIPDDRIYTDDLRCLAWGTDAGFYRHIPQVVVRSKTEEEVSRLLAEASKLGFLSLSVLLVPAFRARLLPTQL